MGDAPLILQTPSDNFGPRRDGLRPELIVLHYTAMTSAEAALERLCDPEAEVSAHYLICARGRVFQMVDEGMRAWHAGAGTWQGKDDINSRSVGIELDNRGDHPFSEPQMAALETLLPAIMVRWNIPPAGIIGHSDMAPGRKIDPGPRFDWRRLARQGLAVWPHDHPADGAASDTWRDLASRFGYPMDEPEGSLNAFRARFRPWATGPLDAEDLRIMTKLTNVRSA
ncbi:N-acetylmuramoyl-L-alanine amidase [Shimia sp.]|uniref:N-acetylmuramoyl-L-alanine amidase n=1 Tax=Shimia sp. TaxID=1954381 RepID=UPI0032982DF3